MPRWRIWSRLPRSTEVSRLRQPEKPRTARQRTEDRRRRADGSMGKLGALDECDGVGGDGEPLADLVNAFIGGGLEADAVDGEAGGFREACLHLGEARIDLRFFRDERCVEVDDMPAEFGELGGHALKEN